MTKLKFFNRFIILLVLPNQNVSAERQSNNHSPALNKTSIEDRYFKVITLLKILSGNKVW